MRRVSFGRTARKSCSVRRRTSRPPLLQTFSFAAALFLSATVPCIAQTNVLSQQYDISRTGANTSETTLTPANVNSSTFGKLFAVLVDGYVYAQPLYVANLKMGAGTPQAGTTHNVMFIATEHDSVYAWDADGNLGANAKPLWQISLLDSAHGAAPGATTVPNGDVSNGDVVPEIGITSTPVIDLSTNTMYVHGKTKENGTYVQRLHALDITTGVEKFGGPVAISASVPGNGNGSSGGTLTFDPKWQHSRPGLLLLNGIVYLGFGSHGDNGPWHGWILAYNATTLTQTGAWCVTPNGAAGGIWLAGTGLAADVPDPTGRPFGRMFTATGNGTFDAASPYNNTQDFGDSIVKLDLSNGVPTMISGSSTVGDDFTPFDQASLNSGDKDPASGGILILPKAASGTQNLLLQGGKTGRVYVLNRENLGGYHPSNTTDPQQKLGLNALYSNITYWNGNVYTWPINDVLRAYSISNGVLSTNPTSTSLENSGFPGSTPAVSANGNSAGIVWNLRTDAFGIQGSEVLYAHDATNVSTLLYASSQTPIRDDPGGAVKFTVPTIANGKVYVGAEYRVSVFGLLNGATQAKAPVINPASQTFSSSVQVTITDSSSGATIYYTTDGSTPTTASPVYSGPFTVTSTQTIQAIAAGPGLLASPISNATYTLQTQVAIPVFNPPPAEYGSARSVAITDSTAGATIRYTTDGSNPSTSSPMYSSPIAVNTTMTLKAFATAPSLQPSPIGGGQYIIDQNGINSFSFSNGFSANSMVLVGAATINGSRLQLTDGNFNEASAAWFPVEASIQTFTTDFTFQILPGTNPTADGFTFAIQSNNTSAVGGKGGGLGYGAGTPTGTLGIPKSVAIKFDLFSNAGESNNSTGLYTNGVCPCTPFVGLTGTGINLHTTDTFRVRITYDGTNLTMTITDTNTNVAFTRAWPIDIPGTIGRTVGFVGFTGATGGRSAVQDIVNWTYSAGSVTQQPAATPVISPATGTFSSPQTVTINDSTTGASIYYTIDGSQPSTSSTLYSGGFTVSSTTTVKAIATAPGFTESGMASSTITIQTGGGGGAEPNFPSGFTATGLQFNGSALLNGSRLQLTNTSTTYQRGSAFWTTPVNVQSFTNDFSFQLSNSSTTADGFTFTIQNAAPTALGPAGGSLGYGGTSGQITKSVAIKFDLFNNAGEGSNSTGLYTNGAMPTVPAIALGNGVNLHNGAIYNVHMTYDGATLAMTISDAANSAATFTTSFPINIASTIGSSTAYAGFTAGTGGKTCLQEILTWTFGP